MIAPQDWSADGTWIAVQVKRRDKTAQVGVVNSKDGSLRVLKSIEWIGSSTLSFSPDSRFLAYDRPSGEDEIDRDVFVIAVDGTRSLQQPIQVTIAWLGGRRMGRVSFISSDRGGTVGLWALPFRGGALQSAEYLDRIRQRPFARVSRMPACSIRPCCAPAPTSQSRHSTQLPDSSRDHRFVLFDSLPARMERRRGPRMEVSGLPVKARSAGSLADDDRHSFSGERKDGPRASAEAWVFGHASLGWSRWPHIHCQRRRSQRSIRHPPNRHRDWRCLTRGAGRHVLRGPVLVSRWELLLLFFLRQQTNPPDGRTLGRNSTAFRECRAGIGSLAGRPLRRGRHWSNLHAADPVER